MALASELMGKAHSYAPKVSGKIRPGIMILTNKAKENPAVVKMYDEGVASQLSFEQIADRLEKAFGNKHLMRPVNVPYFTVRSIDFAMPEIANFILQKYGEDRGEGVKLYRFPIVFGSDNLSEILDFKFQHHTASGMQHWSSDDQGARVCKTFKAIPIVAGKAVRQVGGREVINRNNEFYRCQPSECNEFQTGQCKLRGRMLFYVPGIPGGGMYEIPTGSKNFGFESEKILRDVLQATGGRLRGFGTDKPVFWLTKKLKKGLPMIDYADNGKAKKTDQWVIEIEADIDMGNLIERRANLTLAGSQSAALLAGKVSTGSETTALITASAGAMVAESVVTIDSQPVQTTTQPEPSVKALRAEVAALLQEINITPETFTVYAAHNWGNAWSQTQEMLLKARAEIMEGKRDIENYRDVVFNLVSELN